MKKARTKHSEEEIIEVATEISKKTSSEKPVTNSSLFKCDQCDYKANCNTNLMMHINKDHNEVENEDVYLITYSLSFKCDQCSFEGVSEKRLKQHNRMKHRISQMDKSNSDDCNCLTEENSETDKISFKKVNSNKTDAIDEDFFKDCYTIV